MGNHQSLDIPRKKPRSDSAWAHQSQCDDRRMGLPEILFLVLIVAAIVFVIRRFAGRR
jgi:hypothetical protein